MAIQCEVLFSRQIGRTPSSFSSQKKILVGIAAILFWLAARERISQMDEVFFQPSFSGAKALIFYFVTDYRSAAMAYRSHFQEEYSHGKTSGDEGLDELLKGDIQRARELSERVLAKDPRNTSALLNLGEIALEKGALEDALTIFQRVLQNDDDEFDALLLSAVVQSRLGAYTKALETLDRALRQYKREARVTSLLAVLQTVGDLTQRSKTEQPLCLLANFHRYLRILDDARGDTAIDYAQAAINVGDQPDKAYFIQGVIYSKEGNEEKALQRFLESIKINAEHPESRRRASFIYSNRGDITQEFRMIREAFEVAPLDPFYAAQFTTFLADKFGDYHQGLKVALTALQTTPHDRKVMHLAATLYYRIGEPETAIRYYQELIDSDPMNVEFRGGLGDSLALLGRNDEAVSAYQKAISLDPRNPKLHVRLAQVYWDDLHVKETIVEYELARKLGNLDMLGNLCMAYHRIGEFQRALNCFQNLLKEDPQNLQAKMLMASTLRNLRKAP